MQGKFVPPISDDRHRPFWSVVIPCYNAAHWLSESLGSVLQQDPGQEQMQILVVDDCSTTGSPQEVVQGLGFGRVEFHRQKKNVGKSRNFATGISLATGRWIHILHADDRVDNNFYVEMEKLIQEFPTINAAFCESRYVNEAGIQTGRTGKELPQSGVIPNFERRLYISQRIQTPSIVVRRTAYENLGTFRHDLLLTEDWEMWLRIAVNYEVAFCATTSADYRVFEGNSSLQACHDGTWLKDLKRLADVADDLVSHAEKLRYRSQRNEAIALFIISFLPKTLDKNKRLAALICIANALKWSRGPVVLRTLFSVLLKRITRAKKQISNELI
jgi:glycosyltransferase involved in cell wall biosynthesis